MLSLMAVVLVFVLAICWLLAFCYDKIPRDDYRSEILGTILMWLILVCIYCSYRLGQSNGREEIASGKIKYERIINQDIRYEYSDDK